MTMRPFAPTIIMLLVGWTPMSIGGCGTQVGNGHHIGPGGETSKRDSKGSDHVPQNSTAESGADATNSPSGDVTPSLPGEPASVMSRVDSLKLLLAPLHASDCPSPFTETLERGAFKFRLKLADNLSSDLKENYELRINFDENNFFSRLFDVRLATPSNSTAGLAAIYRVDPLARLGFERPLDSATNETEIEYSCGDLTSESGAAAEGLTGTFKKLIYHATKNDVESVVTWFIKPSEKEADRDAIHRIEVKLGEQLIRFDREAASSTLRLRQ